MITSLPIDKYVAEHFRQQQKQIELQQKKQCSGGNQQKNKNSKTWDEIANTDKIKYPSPFSLNDRRFYQNTNSFLGLI